jgi:hypothetical protein
MIARLLFLFVAVNFSCAAVPPGLTAGPDGSVLKDGRPIRAIGVNYFDCFARTLARGGDTSYDAGFAILASNNIPFARFSACGFWPRDMSLYRTNRAEYFRRFDGVVRSAERHGIGLIPSLFWFHAMPPDYVGEPGSAWGDTNSRTHAFMREYIREVVTRHRDSAAIWAWEFGNEYNLPCDLPNAAQHRPAVWTNLGTAAVRGPKDDLTHDMLVTALRAFGNEVRRHDPHRLITSGNSFPRESAWHNRAERKWTRDTPAQFAEMLALTAPEPVSLISVHCYEGALARVGDAAAVARQLHRPLFVGEFQVPKADTDAARAPFAEFLAALDRHRVPLAAVWVFDFRAQDKDFNINPTNARAWQLPAIGAMNRRWNGK